MNENLHDFFCAGCNERFLRRVDDPYCPRCGMLAATEQLLDPSQPTLLWRSSGDWAAERDREERAEDLHQLVGTRVHIYDCDQFLGRGGMGWVFLARHGVLHRPCALKILSPHLAERDPEYVERFRHEGRATAALNHPNIVTAHAIGEFEDLQFLEMEFVAGRSLQHMLNEHPLSPQRATSMAVGIAAGLSEAHRAGLIHRDLKPDNVLITHRGTPKISDFGLAKRISGGPGESAYTLAGTPHFMAPELFHGEPASRSSDVYALGVVYFQMLTGRLPFARDSMNELMDAVVHEKVPDVRRLRPEVPLEMAECLNLMLDKSPENRPADGNGALLLLEAVQGHLRDLDTLLHDALDREPGVTWKRRNGHYEVRVLLDDGRGQVVTLQNDTDTLDGEIVIFSVCCPSRADYYEQALRLNSTIGHGALSIRDIDGVPHFVMVNTYPRATIDPEEIRRTVRDVAAHADAVEHLLTGADRN
ncbi:Serine/threonine-protein kinase PrkC [Caulifigura coniformis]|uniref:Serine/threonine-protein kinase PrkC n=1 Tax=Caulifigura coniformis TaxID=2527983 RepID=A0A517SG01_9PLAN|nr:serine/threonine-protein kinase [Caulifigura coniformis]QDT55058.1 Serine/threonine-protein kinase PrkC [Caulifigura coniformis]